MDKELIDSFFIKLDEKLNRPAEIIITGAAAGALMGHIRPSTDIDFEMELKTSPITEEDRQVMENTIDQVSKELKIAVNYSDDIGHWSMIDYLDYRKAAEKYKKIGKLTVKIMSAPYWTVGKMSRFVHLDIIDIKEIIRAKKLDSNTLIDIWARAFKASPLSQAKREFKDHVIYFLSKHGRSAWGEDFEPEPATNLFKKKAGLS